MLSLKLRKLGGETCVGKVWQYIVAANLDRDSKQDPYSAYRVGPVAHGYKDIRDD